MESTALSRLQICGFYVSRQFPGIWFLQAGANVSSFCVSVLLSRVRFVPTNCKHRAFGRLAPCFSVSYCSGLAIPGLNWSSGFWSAKL